MLNLGIDAWSNEGAITVVLSKTSYPIKEKWQLATETSGVIHIICMLNITREQIGEFVKKSKKKI